MKNFLKDFFLFLIDPKTWGDIFSKKIVDDTPMIPLDQPVFEPESPKPVPKYLWDTPENVRHSVRVICDEEGLSVKQKNELCATVQCESQGFNIHAINQNKDKKGNVLSTDRGIAQWNDHYHGKEISNEDALNDPEKSIRLMCKYWKAGKANQWVCYSMGLYKTYL